MTDDLIRRGDTGRIVTAETNDVLDLAQTLRDQFPGTWGTVQCTPAHPELWGVHAPDPDTGTLKYGPTLLDWTPSNTLARYVAAVQPENLIPILTRLAYLEAEVVALRKGQGHYAGRET